MDSNLLLVMAQVHFFEYKKDIFLEYVFHIIDIIDVCISCNNTIVSIFHNIDKKTFLLYLYKCININTFTCEGGEAPFQTPPFKLHLSNPTFLIWGFNRDGGLKGGFAPFDMGLKGGFASPPFTLKRGFKK
jgi:hypothetical protein